MKNVHVLLVEDNEGDILLTTEALEEGLNIANISVARNGKEAVSFLLKNKNSNEKLPDFILLDINLPFKNGFEILEFIRNTDELSNIPVIMLTTSSLENDKKKAGSYGANLYLIKPLEVSDFALAVENIKNFWKEFKTISKN